jgi:hypothetical protein
MKDTSTKVIFYTSGGKSFTFQKGSFKVLNIGFTAVQISFFNKNFLELKYDLIENR